MNVMVRKNIFFYKIFKTISLAQSCNFEVLLGFFLTLERFFDCKPAKMDVYKACFQMPLHLPQTKS